MTITVEPQNRPNAAFIRIAGIDPESIPENVAVFTRDHGKAGIGVEVVDPSGLVVCEDNIKDTRSANLFTQTAGVRDALLKQGARVLDAGAPAVAAG